ncbi:MAG: NADH-quinone oxidoreductase subunit C [Bdellovibrionaceae bacterium]|nr:NADH-quinone oxidoreductase subunit C [Pseudobdellovibrionaceae bacterium]
MNSAELLSKILSLSTELSPREKTDRPAVLVPVHGLKDLMLKLRDHSELNFDMLTLATAIDWIKDGKIELVYILTSSTFKHSLQVGTVLDREKPVAPSLSSVWAIAEWQEREIFDLFGVRYLNHPDLRRLLLEDDWKGHPLRKDYVDDFMLERPWR